MYKRDYHKRKALKVDKLWQFYRHTRNSVTEMVRNAKRRYYESSIQCSQHNPTKMWKVIKLLTQGKQRESPPNYLTAEIFNSFFGSIGLDTYSLCTLMIVLMMLMYVGGANCTCHFNFTEIQHFSVKKHLHALGDAANNDVLGFDSKLMILSYDILAPILTKFYNVSIECKFFISDWKLSKVTPICKGKGSKDDAGNYRPINLKLYYDLEFYLYNFVDISVSQLL